MNQEPISLSYLKNIKPYHGYFREDISSIDCQAEIERLSKEMGDIHTDVLRFDKWDFMAIFSVGLLEVAADFLLGNPKKGLSKKLSDKNDGLGRHLNSIHEKLSHSGHPLDYQGYKFGGGTHRSRTFGHDLVMFPLAIYSLCSGKFVDGYYQNNTFTRLVTDSNQFGNLYQGMDPFQAILAYLTHMFADFCSSYSLPVPGFGVLSHFPNHEIRKLVNSMYADGFNLRHMFVQGVPVVCTEILIRIIFYVINRSVHASKEAKAYKLKKMLLMTHSMAMLVNIGKVYFSGNPAAINLPMLIRVMWLCFSVYREKGKLNARAIEKGNLGVLRNKYEMLETMILMDQAIYYTKEIDRFMLDKREEFFNELDSNEQLFDLKFSELNDMISEIKLLDSN